MILSSVSSGPHGKLQSPDNPGFLSVLLMFCSYLLTGEVMVLLRSKQRLHAPYQTSTSCKIIRSKFAGSPPNRVSRHFSPRRLLDAFSRCATFRVRFSRFWSVSRAFTRHSCALWHLDTLSSSSMNSLKDHPAEPTHDPPSSARAEEELQSAQVDLLL